MNAWTSVFTAAGVNDCLIDLHRLVWQRGSWNYDADSAVISVFASPADCAAVPPRPSPSGCGQLYHSHRCLQCREDTKTMPRPLVVPAGNGDSLSSVDGTSASPVPVARPEPQQPEPTTELCHYIERYRPPSLLLHL